GFESLLRLSGPRERLFEVGPERVDILEPDAQAEKILGNAVAFPPVPGLHDGVDATEARRVRDQEGGGLDPPGVTAHVEREEAAEAAVERPRGERIGTEARVTDAFDRRMGGEPARELERALGLAANAEVERLQAAEEEPGRVRRRDRPAQSAQLADAREIVPAARHERAEQDVVVPAEVLRRAVEDEVGAVLERSQEGRRRSGGVDDHDGGMGSRRLEIRKRQERIGRCLEPDEVGALRRRACLFELDDAQSPAFEPAEEGGRPEVAALGEGDRPARAGEREHGRGRGGGARREQQGVAALELAERALRLRAGRMPVARIEEGSRLAVRVRPDRRAIDCRATLHGPILARVEYAVVARRLPPRSVLAAVVLLGGALAAWIVTVARMRGMDAGPGTDLGGLGWYVGIWVVMMSAMMLPSAAPMVLLFARVSAERRRRGQAFVRPWVFVAGY